jgi:hypothetical protein
MRKTEISGPKRRPVSTEFTAGILPDSSCNPLPGDKKQTAAGHGA